MKVAILIALLAVSNSQKVRGSVSQVNITASIIFQAAEQEAFKVKTNSTEEENSLLGAAAHIITYSAGKKIENDIRSSIISRNGGQMAAKEDNSLLGAAPHIITYSAGKKIENDIRLAIISHVAEEQNLGLVGSVATLIGLGISQKAINGIVGTIIPVHHAVE